MIVNLFKSVGTIVEDSIRIYNLRPSYAYVTFSNYEMADLAVHTHYYNYYNNFIILRLQVKHFISHTITLKLVIQFPVAIIIFSSKGLIIRLLKLHLFISRLLNCEVISCKISTRIGPDNKPINSGYGYDRFLHSEDAKTRF